MTGSIEENNKQNVGANAGFAPNTRIRPAQADDAARVSEILAEAFPALYAWTFGRLDTARTARLLHSLYEANMLDLSATLLAEQDGRVVGVIILHTEGAIGRGTLRAYWQVVRKHLGAAQSLRAFCGGVFANAAITRRIPKAEDLVYIEALAVDAQARGQGWGARLLAHAHTWGQAQGRPRMALHVLQSNAVARRLYERFGFRLCAPEPRPAPPGSPRQRWVSLLMMHSCDHALPTDL